MSTEGAYCPRCGGHSRVTNTTHRPEGVLRRRQCLSPACGARFETLEKHAKMSREYRW
jgi:transcriptional regulator NrdR family protein